MIERTKPMQIHKNLMIRCLRDYPDDLANLSPDWTGTAQELIEALESDPREWIVGGKLCEVVDVA